MNYYKQIAKQSNKLSLTLSLVLMVMTLISCDYEFDLPEANSIADATPPSADFSATVSSTDHLTINFANLSTSATDYSWDFGDGNSSTSKDGQNTYPDIGTYTVTLTATDKLGASDAITKTVEVVEPAAVIPNILESGFEDNSLPDGSGDGRDSWRNSDLGGVIQITSSPVQEGSQASKYPSAGDRIAYQELVVSPDTDYVLTYYYTLKTGNPGSITVSVLAGGGFTDLDTAKAAAIESFEGSDQTDASTYVKVDLPFNTGDNSVVSILVTNQGEEARLDSFSIDLQ